MSRRSDDSAGAVVGMIFLLIAVVTFYIAITLLTIGSIAKGLVYLGEGKWIKGTLLLCFAALLINSEYEADLYGLRGCENRPAPVVGQPSQSCDG
jgi:hypothetical protein